MHSINIHNIKWIIHSGQSVFCFNLEIGHQNNSGKVLKDFNSQSPSFGQVQELTTSRQPSASCGRASAARPSTFRACPAWRSSWRRRWPDWRRRKSSRCRALRGRWPSWGRSWLWWRWQGWPGTQRRRKQSPSPENGTSSCQSHKNYN